MKKVIGNHAVALSMVALAASLVALPAQAVQVSFSGSSGVSADTDSGVDPLGNTWVTSNGPEAVNSSFTMANAAEAPQIFNRLDFSNGRGDFANSFQLTVNKSQQGSGFKGILLSEVASTLVNDFIVKPDLNDASTWYAWTTTYNLMDSGSGLFQQILFTAPTGTQLSQGEDFNLNINFSGIITTDSGFAASWDDRAAPNIDLTVPEPGSMALVGLGLAGIMALARRRRS